MKIHEDRSHMNIDTRWFEKGYIKEDVHGKSPGYESICSPSLLGPIDGAAYHPAFCAAIPSSMICAAARTILLVLLLPGVR